MKQVIVKDMGEIYEYYDEWIALNFPSELKNFKAGEAPLKDRIYNVLGHALHEDAYFGTLYLIQDIDTKQVYMVAKEGLKFIEERKMIINIETNNYEAYKVYLNIEDDIDSIISELREVIIQLNELEKEMSKEGE